MSTSQHVKKKNKNLTDAYTNMYSHYYLFNMLNDALYLTCLSTL